MNLNPLSGEKLQHHPRLCSQRVQRDMMAFIQEPPPGIFATSDDSDLTLVHALIIGPANTPYEGGFFYFLVMFPYEYPIKPPTVKLMTTGGSRVRFNPNLYKSGKVCLSILGTWEGPSWSPAQTLTTVLISIQSLLCEKPYHNEPGYETEESQPGDVQRYNDVIQHETLRVAVVGMLDNDFGLNVPASIREVMETSFIQMYDKYEAVAKGKVHLTGTPIRDPFGHNSGHFQWATVLERLKNTYDRLNCHKNEEEVNGNSSHESVS